MPDLPPSAATANGELLTWIIGVLGVVVVWQQVQIGLLNKKNDTLSEKHADEKSAMAVLLTKVEVGLSELRAGQTKVKDALYALRDRITGNAT